ncbi:hypothetical protein DQ04_00861110 [Trypanosoma grayi]|uniref:hypothetical protein n=1 Tax=Trypanosoma grayi TaxID=71804 RepID=UPI0004F49FF4|nr:hypothetical protein DQ04_00861110 [Trypanosoma grayi]KEG13669.1 hypothetical protein DQ04_00861110 [Trypanosoma grayi]
MVGCMRRCVWSRLLVFLVFFFLTSSFTPAALDWALMQRRTSLQAILTRMSPYFVRIHTAPDTEDYYGLWRYHDFGADAYRQPRTSGIPAVPIVYVHGNAGSFQDMRSLGRFVGEANVQQRHRRAEYFKEDVKRALFNIYKQEKRRMPVDGEEIPKDLQQRAEDAVLADTPLLGAELVGVDFVEESNTHSGILLLKEARFLNYSVHLLLQGLMDHYKEVLTHTKGGIRKKSGDPVPKLSTVSAVETEYIDSVCQVQEETMQTKSACSIAKEQLDTFSSVERIRRELERVQKEGIWMWTESLGGIVAVFAAVLAPHMYAGLVMAGPPLRYPPLLFDMSCVDYQRVVHNAVMVSYAYSNASKQRDWSKIADARFAPLDLLRNLRNIPSQEIAARMASVSMITIHGGSLEDIVPPRSSFVARSTGRYASSSEHQQLLPKAPPPAGRRDVCTEELRGCGISLTHRGLVYAQQLLDVAGDSLVKAALTPKSGELMGIEPTIPPTRDRLFPMVVETFPHSLDTHRIEEFHFVNSLNETEGHDGYRKEETSRVLSVTMTNVCVEGRNMLNLQEIPTDEERDSESWKPLHLFVGATTYIPQDVYLPTLTLVDAEQNASFPDMEVTSRAATKLHLPIRRKDGEPTEGNVLQTVISFQLLQKKRPVSPRWVRPLFCFSVYSTKLTKRHFSFVQHDIIDPLRETASPMAQKEAITAQMSGHVSVENYGRFALIRNLDSISMETNMVVRAKDGVVFPHLICGSFRSFRLAFRGTEGLAMDEPESQLQYFFGPYEEGRETFHYSWRPFHTVPFNLTNIYVAYLLTADEQPTINLVDLQMYQSPRWNDHNYWVWRFNQWTMRWMAVLSTYSVSGKFVGCYVLSFLTMYVTFYMPRFVGHRTESQLSLRTLRSVSPVLMVLIVSLGLEYTSSALAKKTMRVCLDDNPPLKKDEELTAMMSLAERLTLMFLYALPPRYEECKYSWIRMQTVPPGDVQIDHMLHLVCAFCFAVLVFLFECAVFALTRIVSFVCQFPFRNRLRRVGISPWVLGLLWCMPIVMHATIPWMHISITTTVACLVSYCVIWCIPYEVLVAGGPQYRWLCFLLVMLGHLTAHFEGLVLVLRNYFIVSPVTLRDKERCTTLLEHLEAFAIVQCNLAVVYTTVYLTLRHHSGVVSDVASKKKEVEVTNSTGSALCRENGTNLKRDQLPYVLGDFGRRYPRFWRLLRICSSLVILLGLWVSLVSLRRPLEGSIALLGVCIMAVYVALVLVRLW